MFSRFPIHMRSLNLGVQAILRELVEPDRENRIWGLQRCIEVEIVPTSCLTHEHASRIKFDVLNVYKWRR